jgi:hypothetical protein
MRDGRQVLCSSFDDLPPFAALEAKPDHMLPSTDIQIEAASIIAIVSAAVDRSNSIMHTI